MKKGPTPATLKTFKTSSKDGGFEGFGVMNRTLQPWRAPRHLSSLRT